MRKRINIRKIMIRNKKHLSHIINLITQYLIYPKVQKISLYNLLFNINEIKNIYIIIILYYYFFKYDFFFQSF